MLSLAPGLAFSPTVKEIPVSLLVDSVSDTDESIFEFKGFY